MNDCPRAEMRDQLPDLLHDRLSAGERAAVLAHVDGCAECQGELELLRGVRRAMLTTTPRIDTSRIVAALPKPGANVALPLQKIRPSRSRWADWRIAATITVLAGGATSAALLMRSPRPSAMPIDTVAVTPVGPSAARDTTTMRPIARAVDVPVKSTPKAKPVEVAVDFDPSDVDVVPSADVETDARLKRLNDRQLRALLDEIEQFKAVPITEPEPVVINVNGRSSSGTSDRTDFR